MEEVTGCEEKAEKKSCKGATSFSTAELNVTNIASHGMACA
jgi:hypothetical protein